MPDNRYPILNTYVNAISMEETVSEVEKIIKAGKPTQHVVINALKVNLMREDEELREQLSIAKNSARISAAVHTAYELLHESDMSVLTSLRRAADELEAVGSYSDRISLMAERSQNAYYELEDISDGLRELGESFNYSEEDMDSISERLAVIEDAVRKYRMHRATSSK